MAVADFLEKVGHGLETGAKAVGTAALPVLQRTAEVVSGEAPQLDEDKRNRQEKMEDEQIAVRATALENNLAMGQKYGTLTPEQQQQYIDQITGLYSHPRHAATLMEKLRKTIHPNGAYAQGPQAPLANAEPAGGTAAADEANAEKLAAARYHAQPKKGFDQFLDIYSRENGIEPDQMTEAQLEDAHTKYYQQTHQQMLDKEIVEDPESPTGFSVSEIDRRTGKQVSSFQGVRPPAGFVPKHRVSYSKDQYGNETTTVSDVTPVMGKPGASGDTGAKKPSVGGILGGNKPAGAKQSDTAQFMVTPNPKGLVEPGNLPIWNRPTIQNADGSHSSEYSTSFQDERGHEVLVPTIVDGKFLTPDGKKPKQESPEEKAMFKAAWDHYLKTGENLGKFDNPDDADAYAGILHNRGQQKPKGVAGIIGKSTGAKPVTQPRQSVLPKAPPKLDATGHIPSTAGNPQIVQFANDLIDDRDTDKIPAKARASAEAMAKNYAGWSQGALTPIQKTLVNEAAVKLKQLGDSPSLAVLDDGGSRAKITAVLYGSSGKSGFTGEQIGSQVARTLTPQEQEFIRDYNAAVGVIGGLGPITRGNRPTEAAVARLMQEMPSILQSANSADGKQRVQQLLQEIQTAIDTKGNTPLGGVGGILGGANDPLGLFK